MKSEQFLIHHTFYEMMMANYETVTVGAFNSRYTWHEMVDFHSVASAQLHFLFKCYENLLLLNRC